MDKPVFIVASLTLAILFVVLYYTAVSGWVEGVIEQFTETMEELP